MQENGPRSDIRLEVQVLFGDSPPEAYQPTTPALNHFAFPPIEVADGAIHVEVGYSDVDLPEIKAPVVVPAFPTIIHDYFDPQ